MLFLMYFDSVEVASFSAMAFLLFAIAPTVFHCRSCYQLSCFGLGTHVGSDQDQSQLRWLLLGNGLNSTFPKFDLIFISVGTLPWMLDLDSFFQKANSLLKKNGYIVIKNFISSQDCGFIIKQIENFLIKNKSIKLSTKFPTFSIPAGRETTNYSSLDTGFVSCIKS